MEKEMMSLNQNLFNEFSIQELEERLETDPLLLSSLFNLGANAEVFGNCGCNKIKDCPILGCGSDNVPPCQHTSCTINPCPSLESIG